ncbi:MAG: SpoIIE family protein phosphatase [Clostridia bacterium]
MKNKMFLDIGYCSLNKSGEELCGDKVEYILNDSGATIVLADGLGSGVKANILSTLTSRMLCNMISNDIEIEDCVETVAKTLPVCKIRNVAYSTFSIIKIDYNGVGKLIEYDNPQAILLENGKCKDLKRTKKVIAQKDIYLSDIALNENSALLIASDGVLHAGIGKLLNFGWDRKDIIKYIEKASTPKMSARCLTSLLANACNDLYQNEPGDDTTVAAIKIINPTVTNMMIGPPSNKNLDKEVIGKFLDLAGKHIVCGGTTSQIVAKFLHTEVKTNLDYIDDTIPPIGQIEGIDLTTEGVLTLRKLIELSKKYIDVKNCELKQFASHDGASLLGNILFETSTEINIFVGQAVNTAHNNLEIENTIKILLVEQLADILKKLNKTVTVQYF